MAGPNAGGSLLISEIADAEYTVGGSVSNSRPVFNLCRDATTRHDGIETIVLSIFAAFPSAATPRLAAAAFGWTYDESVLSIVDWGPCASFEISTDGWPAPGQGTAVSWGSDNVQTSSLIEVYWAAAYDYYGVPATLQLIRNPLGNGDFVDDSIPALDDEIVAFGSFGFFTRGELPCPPERFAGICCLGDACSPVSDRDVCERQDGAFLAGIACDPDPCSVAIEVVESLGAAVAPHRN
jgi:hypothetical protein